MPVEVDGKTALISASIGVVTYPSCGEDGEILIRRADAAMYSVKEEHKKGFRFWDSSISGAGK